MCRDQSVISILWWAKIEITQSWLWWSQYKRLWSLNHTRPVSLKIILLNPIIRENLKRKRHTYWFERPKPQDHQVKFIAMDLGMLPLLWLIYYWWCNMIDPASFMVFTIKHKFLTTCTNENWNSKTMQHNNLLQCILQILNIKLSKFSSSNN